MPQTIEFREIAESFSVVDSGEQLPVHNRTPILVADSSFDATYVSSRFEKAGRDIPSYLRRFVSETLAAYPRNSGTPQGKAD